MLSMARAHESVEILVSFNQLTHGRPTSWPLFGPSCVNPSSAILKSKNYGKLFFKKKLIWWQNLTWTDVNIFFFSFYPIYFSDILMIINERKSFWIIF